MPGRHGGVAQQGPGVGGDRRAERRRRRSVAAAPSAGREPGELGRGRRGRRPVAGEQPGADAHGRRRLQHPQHVGEPRRPAEVVHQGHGAEADGAGRAELGPPGQDGPAGELGAGGQHRRGPGQAAEEQVAGDVRWRATPGRLRIGRP